MCQVIICSSHKYKQKFCSVIVVVPGLGDILEPTPIQSAQQMPNALVKDDVIFSSKPGSKIPSTNFEFLHPTQKPTILPLIMMMTTFGATKPCCDPSFHNNTSTTTDARILYTKPYKYA